MAQLTLPKNSKIDKAAGKTSVLLVRRGDTSQFVMLRPGQ